MQHSIKLDCAPILIVIGMAALAVTAASADAQLLHLWDFSPGSQLQDSAGGLHLNVAIGEGDVGGVMGQAGDITYEPGFNGFGQAYRPSYVDASQSSTAGAGLTGSGFTTPNQFTIETIVKADNKTSGSAVNYLFQTRPGSDRGYFLIQDEDNLSGGGTTGMGTIIGNNFGDVGITAEYSADGTWLYVAAVIDLTSTPGQASADLYMANLTAGETSPTLVANGRTWNTADPSALAGATGIFGIGNFAIDRNGDTVAEASQEWFQGAVDYIAIYNGLLGRSELQANLDDRLVPEPSSIMLCVLGAAGLAVRRRR